MFRLSHTNVTKLDAARQLGGYAASPHAAGSMRPPPAPPAAPRLGSAPSRDTTLPQIQGGSMEAELDSTDVDIPIYEVHDIGEFTLM